MEKISKIEKDINLYLNEDNCYGKFYLDSELNEMSRFGKIPDIAYEIHIEGEEGNIPHMHICKKNGENIVLRINLLTNEYFREKDDVKNILNSTERKALDNYLSKDIPYRENYTEWDRLIDQWNEYNPGHMVNPKQYKKPSYVTINEPF